MVSVNRPLFLDINNEFGLFELAGKFCIYFSSSAIQRILPANKWRR